MIEDGNQVNHSNNNEVQIDIKNLDNNQLIENHLENNIILEENNIQSHNSIEMKDLEENKDSNKITTLPCGHRFHFKCISIWMIKKQQTCPICREKINVDLPENNDDSDLQSELINIQTDLHPAFALLIFESINQELTWGIAAGPAIGSGWLAGIFGLGAGGFALA